MTVTETRYPCPVCLGVKLEKVRLSAGTASMPATVDVGAAAGPDTSAGPAGAAAGPDTSSGPAAAAPARADSADDLILDHCARCGGIWFEAGEIRQLAKSDAELLWRAVVRREGVPAMRCHFCRSPLARTEQSCAVCGWEVELDCPTCARPMRSVAQQGMQVDCCEHCKGVWFDHDELAGIWRMHADAVVARRARTGGTSLGADLLFDVMLFDPLTAIYGAHAAAHIAGAAAEGLAHAAGSVDVVGEVAGAAGDVAAGVFGTVVEIIAGIFG
jgi:Zn-finger nucleic acid-binding protein